MIHLNSLDFNVCRFEEVISFYWRSVYIQKVNMLLSFQVVHINTELLSVHTFSAENQKSINAVQQCSLQNQKGATAIDFVQW